MVIACIAAIVLAVLLSAVWVQARNRSAAVAAVLWLLYAVYELLMQARVLCSGECNIRVDLLLIYPVLVLFTSIALISAFNKLRRKGRT